MLGSLQLVETIHDILRRGATKVSKMLVIDNFGVEGTYR